eukprot:TRINITY_DN67981_c0_g1_i1.p1 TRINITY_DN67981_c0_g1~~TRINITY_DN67981_c0_g1_i1.p1  ORF type:complete len:312 (+),score=54.53 TRINITY_DN67981_c0_g1_i1:121-1056(+)
MNRLEHLESGLADIMSELADLNALCSSLESSTPSARGRRGGRGSKSRANMSTVTAALAALSESRKPRRKRPKASSGRATGSTSASATTTAAVPSKSGPADAVAAFLAGSDDDEAANPTSPPDDTGAADKSDDEPDYDQMLAAARSAASACGPAGEALNQQLNALETLRTAFEAFDIAGVGKDTAQADPGSAAAATTDPSIPQPTIMPDAGACEPVVTAPIVSEGDGMGASVAPEKAPGVGEGRSTEGGDADVAALPNEAALVAQVYAIGAHVAALELPAEGAADADTDVDDDDAEEDAEMDALGGSNAAKA